MRRFSALAGPLQPSPNRNVKILFTDIKSFDKLAYRTWTRILAYGTLIITLGYAADLFQPAHWIVIQRPDSPTYVLNWIMLVCLVLLQLFLIIGTFSATRATLLSKNPLPLQPPSKLRVAFITTRAPGEPEDMVRTTLEAAKRIRYPKGVIDVWLLDETNDPILQELCSHLKVKYFSRAGIAVWNSPKPPSIFSRIGRIISNIGRAILGRPVKRKVKPNPIYAARSKHGNINAWRAYLKENQQKYDIIAGVDTDHVPQPNYLERLLGYFRDPNVAYVVGPQVYGNYGPGLKGLVARWAESQASFFQSTIQRAGNTSESPMFVGTNYAIRTAALDQIGGFQPCITEDMATGLAIHTHRNPRTGARWKSVYTPDVLAVGEGPAYWGPYFTQQWRWAAGTFDTWKRSVWRLAHKLSRGSALHYFLMLTFYPITALTWLLGIISSMTYLLTGATAVLAPWNQFVSLYMMSLVMQLSLYFWNRRFNVSPHEPEGSYGVAGMALTALTAPIYFSALLGILFGKKPHFVVTTKGSNENPDGFKTFRIHLQWALLLILGLVYGFMHNHDHPAMIVWVASQLLICFVPVALGMTLVFQERWNKSIGSKQVILQGEEQHVY